MSVFRKVLIIVTVLSLLNFISAESTEDDITDWDKPCPKTCTCHRGHFSQLHFTSMIHSDTKHPELVPTNDKPSYQERNEVLYEEDEKSHHFQKSELIMKMAVCIIYEENELETLTDIKDVEALTLLQSSSDENITLRREDFKELENLKILEIHGIDQQKYNQKINRIGYFQLKHNALQNLMSLEYLNLQNIQLLGNPQQGNKIPPVSAYDYVNQNFESNQLLPIIYPNYEQKVQRKSNINIKPIVKRLVFLTPNDIEPEIIPYEVYKDEQQKAGLYSFAGLRNLKFLRIYRCNLSEINWEMFDGLHNLETLSLEGNDLLFIPEFAFYGTPSLKSLSLTRNKLLNVQSMSLAGLLQLKHLDLSYNNISHLSELSLPPLPKLSTADFTNNPLEIIFPSTFEIMNATQQLHLGSLDTVLDIQPNSFNGLHSLLKLTIKSIDIDILERELLRGMPQLHQLIINGRISSIAFDAFLDMPKLEKLVLKNCSIKKLSMDSFYGLYDLRLLDLSHNRLDLLPPGLFDQQFSLKELYLHHNNLTILPVGFLSNIPAKIIRLDANPWHCSCAMKDWKPSIINQVKQKVKDNGMCQFRFDKGSMCSLTDSDEYVYDKKAEPRCSTPTKYKGRGIFQLLRKELRCDKKQKIMKINRKTYLAQKLLDYEKMKESEKMLYSFKFHHSKKSHDNTRTNWSQSVEKDESTSTETEHKNTTKIPIVEKDFLKTLVTRTSDEPKISELVFEKKMLPKKNESNQFDFKNSTIIELDNSADSLLNVNTIDKEKSNQQQTEIKGQKLSKKEKEKLQMLKEKEERLKMKEKIKNSENIDANVLKKVWKLELENKRKEKLKLLSNNSLF
ncbi:uncharacterized protein LOC142323082 [Lycorma delicatula]|uniref:uncharacterized protein LOC142323082 n=1 Tax=Lycorma delicatula TaxID=130591 RepID=UPI003F514558